MALCSNPRKDIRPPQTHNPFLNAREPFMEIDFGIRRQNIHLFGKALHPGGTGHFENEGEKPNIQIIFDQIKIWSIRGRRK